MSRLLLLFCVGAGALLRVAAQPVIYPYSVPAPAQMWAETFGNHRAVIDVPTDADAVELDFLWRRHDANPELRQFLIINATTGDTVRNILRKSVDNERCNITFGPVSGPSLYYFYYLPYPVNRGHGSYDSDYFGPESAPDPQWVAKIGADGPPPRAALRGIEARTAFDSFYPMEVVALNNEVAGYTATNTSAMLVFPEDRTLPIRMRDKLPSKWMDVDQGAGFSGTADINEYYTYQVGVYAPSAELRDLGVEWSELCGPNDTIAKSAITCFNTEGYDPDGKYFTKNISVPAGHVQPLWMGVDIATNAAPGVYTGSVTIAADGVPAHTVPLEITISDNILADRGDSEVWRHSRLRWLNSRAGIDNTPTRGYSDIEIKGNRIGVEGRTLTLAKTGLPGSITVGTSEILDRPVEFVITTTTGAINLKGGKPRFTLRDRGHAEWVCDAANKQIAVSCHATMEFDGWVNYTYTVTPLIDIDVTDIRLNIPLKGDKAGYMMGMGLEGGKVPTAHSSKWHGVKQNLASISTTSDAPVKLDGPMDSFWVGNAHSGLHCELRGASYTGPLLNLYQPAPPTSWNNDGKGGFEIARLDNQVVASAYSGERSLKAGQAVVFDFAMLITPVKAIDYHSQFTDRYYHNGATPTPTDQDVEAGVRIINVHHANAINPYINYPFLTTSTVKEFTDKWHAKGSKVKLYYTVRELTNAVPEIWALRSLGDEILADGGGGGYPWLREHLVTGYVPQWYSYLGPMQSPDASIVNSPGQSRWYNYYVQGLGWMVRNLGIDGIYLDDVAYGRDMLKRMRRVMDAERPGCIIDLHSNTGFSRGAAIQYAEFFPYVDKLWFGESFYYDKMSPENWLVEVSGIPYGLMSDMLHRGGNRWRGMVYGMTVRHPWVTDGIQCDPRPIWRVWDMFDIADAQMIGYWEPNPPVTTDNDKVLATTYINKRGEVLIAVASWADEPVEFSLKIDSQALGLKSAPAEIWQPEVTDFQPEAHHALNARITVAPTKGYMFILK